MVFLYQIFKIFILILLSTYTIICAEVYIDITQGIIHNPRPISIIPFYNAKQDILLNIDDVSHIIAADLQNTGKFISFPDQSFPEYPKKISEINVEKWLNIGINIIVIGKINKINNNYTIFYQLVDISNHPISIILENQYTVSKQWIRYAAHTISNDIFKKITGIQGIFCTRIAYIVRTVNTQYPYKLYISYYDGHNEILIYHSQEPLMSPTWDPSGNQLAYVTFTNNNSMIVLHNLNTGSIRQLVSFPRHNGAPSFSHNGKKLACSLSKTGSLNLYVIDLISNKIKQITNERSNNTEPSWFPDDKTLSYTSDKGGTPQIYKINTDDTNCIPKRISWLNLKNQNSIVSSDGTFLIMISSNNNQQNVIKLNLLTEEYTKLTNTTLNESSTLSPNNNMIIYSTSEGLSSKLYLLSIDNQHKSLLPINHEYIRFPAWSSYINQ